MRPGGARALAQTGVVPRHSRLAQRVLASTRVDGELARLLLQVVGVIAMTIAIGLLVPFAEPRDERTVDDDRPNRTF